MQARALIAFPGEDLLVVVLVLEEGLRVVLDLDDRGEARLGRVDLFRLLPGAFLRRTGCGNPAPGGFSAADGGRLGDGLGLLYVEKLGDVRIESVLR